MSNNATIMETVPNTKIYQMQPTTAGNFRSMLKITEKVDVLSFLQKENSL